MSDPMLRVLELAEKQAREGGVAVPEAVLEGLTEATGARGGRLGRGADVLARRGEDSAASLRLDIPAGRDVFWLEIVGGSEPSRADCLTARVALSSWIIREELKKARFAERRRLWEVESLRAIAEVLGGTLESESIAEALVLHATALLDARRGEVWLPREPAAASASQVGGQEGGGSFPRPRATVAARVGGPVLDDEEAASLAESGLLEERRLAVPIVGRRGRLGIVALADREVRGGLAAFAATDAETLQLFASQAAVALENATLHHEALERQLLERELEVAAAVQRELLPSSFVAPEGFEIAARTEPCRHVGGDVYDLVTTPGGLVLMAGDVTGKGVPAALMASSLQASVRLLARTCPDVSELAAQLHEHLLATTPQNKFATLFLGCLLPGGELTYVSAGHNPTILVGPDGGVELLHASAPPLGLLPGTSYSSQQVSLRPGALLVAYTDGFSEAPGEETGEDYGVGRLVALAQRLRHDPLDRLVAEAFEDVSAFTGRQPAHDDRTLLVVRRSTVS